jgi:putrescine transport system permease protein
MTPIPAIKSPLRTTVLWLGFGFLYLPIWLLILFSFNESRLVTVWAGFSVKWYGELFADTQIMDAIALSLTIGFFSACMAVILGTLSAFVLTRVGRFKGKTAFNFLITAPMVMPDVITGLALLLLFVAMSHWIGWPAQRGAMTIWIAHVTFTAAYVTVIVRSRLQELDGSIEEAALDLGATPLKVFFLITLPSIAPAIAAGWLFGRDQFCVGSQCDNAAHGDFFQCPSRSQPENQCPGDPDYFGGFHCNVYWVVDDGAERKASES